MATAAECVRHLSSYLAAPALRQGGSFQALSIVKLAPSAFVDFQVSLIVLSI